MNEYFIVACDMRRLALSLLRIIQRRPVSSDITDLLAWAENCRANINGTLKIGTLHVLSLACRESEGWPNGLRAGCERLAEEITRATKGDDDATGSASTLLLKAHAVADEICALGLRVNPVVEVFQHLNESIREREKQELEHGNYVKRLVQVLDLCAVLKAADAQRQAGDEVRRVEAIMPRDDRACELAESNWRVAARASDEANRVLREGGLIGNMPKKDANDLAAENAALREALADIRDVAEPAPRYDTGDEVIYDIARAALAAQDAEIARLQKGVELLRFEEEQAGDAENLALSRIDDLKAENTQLRKLLEDAVADMRRYGPDSISARWIGAVLSALAEEAHDA